MLSTAADDSYDPSFSALPPHLRQRIDRAFNVALSDDPDAQPARARSSTRQKLDHVPSVSGPSTSAEPGGFVIDDADPGGFVVDELHPGGGFLLDDHSDNDNGADDPPSRVHPAAIPLSLIPTALQLLDLQPDDEDVLFVFRNAASGWAGEHHPTHSLDDTEAQFVSRKDWRAVCAALLDPGDADAELAESEDAELDSETADQAEVDDDDSGSEDDFTDSGDEPDTENDDDEEYHEGGFVASKPKGTGARSPKKRAAVKTTETRSAPDFDADALRSRRITPRQKQECRRVFSLFFPEVSDMDLGKQRIKISDISRVAKLLKEELKAEEIIEMLEAFSTSPDKSMSLADFERMMIATHLA